MTDDMDKERIDLVDEEERGGVFAVSENFGTMLRHYRVKVKDMTLKELESVSQISASYLNRLERSEKTSPSLPVVCRLAECLAIPYSVLIATTFQPKEAKVEPTLSDVLIQNNYAVNGQNLTKEAKEMLLKINEFIVTEIKWTAKTRVHELYLLSEMLDDFKAAM